VLRLASRKSQRAVKMEADIADLAGFRVDVGEWFERDLLSTSIGMCLEPVQKNREKWDRRRLP